MSTYLVTGATGYIGSQLTMKLLDAGEDVWIQVRNPSKIKRKVRERLHVICGDIVDSHMWKQVNCHVDYIIHCAAPTESAYMMTHPVETAETIVQGTKNVLEYCKNCPGCKLIYLSSMEVYGNIACKNGERVTEEQLGSLDICAPRNCYPIAKRMAEHLCIAYFREYGVETVVARLSQTFGRGVLATDKRVFAQFANAVREKKDIVLHTLGNSVGNYCDIDDTLEAIGVLLQKGEAGEIYNVVNEDNTMSIRHMAEMVADKIAGGQIRVTFDIPNENIYGYAVDTGLRMSGDKMRRLGWSAKVSLEEMYRRLLEGME